MLASSGVVLAARSVRKAYGGAHALKGVDMDLRAGGIHALIGANGAGKSTLCRILAGVEAPDSGELTMDGVSVRFGSVRDAVRHGVGIVHQELSLFPNMSVSDNLFAGHEAVDGLGLVDQQRQRRRCAEILARLGQNIDPGTLVGELPVGKRQMIEIARALMQECRVLIMDEPTSALSQAEIPRLFEVVRGLASQGVAVVYISHRLGELLALCDEVTVLRDGVVSGRGSCSGIGPAWIVERMTGGQAGEHQARRASGAASGQLLEVRNLSLPHKEDRVALADISLDLSAGEVLGLYGLMGAGRTELLETLLGLHPDAEGRISLQGRDLAGSGPAERVAAGMALVPEDRQRDALVHNLPVVHNMTLSALRRLAPMRWLRPGNEWSEADAAGRLLHLKAPGLAAPVQALSGGNQQKVVLARCMLSRPRLLLLDEPTRGVDVAAKAEIAQQIQALANEGIAVILASSEAEEIMSLAGRVLVLSRGSVVMNRDIDAMDEAVLAEAAASSVAN